MNKLERRVKELENILLKKQAEINAKGLGDHAVPKEVKDATIKAFSLLEAYRLYYNTVGVPTPAMDKELDNAMIALEQAHDKAIADLAPVK